LRQKKDDPVMAATMQHVMSHAGFLFPGIQDPTDPRLMALMGKQRAGTSATNASEQSTTRAVPNPLSAGAAQVAQQHPEQKGPRPPLCETDAADGRGGSLTPRQRGHAKEIVQEKINVQQTNNASSRLQTIITAAAAPPRLHTT